MVTKTKKRVLLFKKQDTIDQYNDLLEKANYIPQFIPVLTHQSDNLEKIQHILQQGPTCYNALILTSQRSVQAITEAHDQLATELTQAVKEEWNMLPIYIVGPHTASLLQQVPLFKDNSKEHWTVAPRAAELIGPLIQDFQGSQGSTKLLFLAGDKRRDLIPTELLEAHIEFEEIQSYVTCVHPDLSDNLQKLSCAPDWVVYFSPSGLKFLLDTPTYKSFLAASVKSKSTKLAAIGPTTAEYIKEALGQDPDVTADKPDAQHLVDAIIQFDSSFA